MKGLLFLIVFTSTFFGVQAQSYYFFVHETSLTQGGFHIYKTLLSLQADGTASARIQYNAGDGNKLYLYNLSLTDSTINITDTTHKYLVCREAPLPLLDADSAGFVLPRFIFKKKYDGQGYYYEPEQVEVANGNGQWMKANMTTAMQKNLEDLRQDEPFLGSFYFESDAFYKFVFEENTRAIPMARPEKMFLLMVANTNDPTIGTSAATDLNNITTLFTSVARNLGISKIIPLTVSGNNYGKPAMEATLATLERLNPSPIDIVVFYYSGHGFRLKTDKSEYPRMSFRTASNRANREVGDNIPLEDVYNRIHALKPRVCLVLGDCCNADIYANPVFGTDMIKPKGGGTLGNFNFESAKKLFLPTLPLSILVGSVKKDHLSLGHPAIGGYYTHFFTSELEKNLWGYYSSSLLSFAGGSNSSWLKILLDARKNTYWKSKAKQCGKTVNDRCIQEAEISVTPM
ncbi:MAG: caspase family protein [Ferruginibacter sp.]